MGVLIITLKSLLVDGRGIHASSYARRKMRFSAFRVSSSSSMRERCFSIFLVVRIAPAACTVIISGYGLS